MHFLIQILTYIVRNFLAMNLITELEFRIIIYISTFSLHPPLTFLTIFLPPRNHTKFKHLQILNVSYSLSTFYGLEFVYAKIQDLLQSFD
jgi:hypothetical protein